MRHVAIMSPWIVKITYSSSFDIIDRIAAFPWVNNQRIVKIPFKSETYVGLYQIGTCDDKDFLHNMPLYLLNSTRFIYV